MRLECESCNHEWESDRESLEAFEDGPRCSSCQSRDVARVDADDEGDPLPYVAAFELIEEEGAGPLDLVRDPDLGLGPDEAREIINEYKSLASDYSLVSAEEMQEIRQEDYENGRDRGREEGKRKAKKQLGRSMERQKKQAYNQGYNDALRQSRMKQALEEFRPDKGAYVD